MDRTDAKPLQSSRSSSSSSTKQKYGETKTEVSYPVQESLSRQESAYSSMGSSDFSLRSGSQGDFQHSPKPANGPRSMGDSGFVRLVVEFVFLNPTLLLIPESKNCDF